MNHTNVAARRITNDDLVEKRYGKKGTSKREAFDAKIEALCLCETIRAKRIEAGLTQQQLADLAQVNRSFVSRVENGKANARLATLIQLLKQLDLKISLTSIK